MNYKKIFTAWMSLFLCCTNANAEVVSLESAAAMAKKFMDSMGCFNKKFVPLNSYEGQTKSRVSRAEHPAFHIFHGENNEGFVVVSGDDIVRPILGYSFNNIECDSIGHFPPAMLEWLSEIETQILYARQQGLQQSEKVAQEWALPEYSNCVVQLKTAKWNQDAPYNMQCPLDGRNRSLTGCTSTAYAIMMKYYGFPERGRGVTQEYTCESSGVYVAPRNLDHEYKWDKMPLEYKSGQYDHEQATCVAQLMADIGAAIQADYSYEATSAYYGKSEILVHFGLNPGIRKIREEYSTAEWYSMLCSELDMKRPILYSGSPLEGDGSGHAFILDGYTDQNTFSVNWGWGGSYNGIFALDALVSSNYDYRGGQEAYLDCVPATSLPVVAKVGDIECPSLKIALDLVPENGELTQITLLQSVDMNHIRIEENQNVELNLNGFTINIEEYGFYNYGKIRITDTEGTGKINVVQGNCGIFNNYGSLVIEAGEFSNLVGLDEEDTDYRRCVWSDEESITEINGGSFTSVNQVMCFNGEATINGGLFQCADDGSVILNFCKSGKLTINDGIFKSIAEDGDDSNSRRCCYIAEGTTTEINGGKFICTNCVLLVKGDFTINDGYFQCIGNSEVIANYALEGTLTIEGGTFENSYLGSVGDDYCRSIWTADGTTTHVNGGTFRNESTTQTLCFNGEAIIAGGVIENIGTGISCASSGNVKITDCMLSGNWILYAWSGCTLKCSGGLYSQKVEAKYLEQGYECFPNNDSTSSKYPYRVDVETGIAGVEEDKADDTVYYDLNGKRYIKMQRGVNIIYDANGKVVKILHQ